MKRMNEKELAKRWGLTERTLQKWRRLGVGPAFTVIGQHTVLYLEEDVLAYERSKRQGGESLPEPEGWREAMQRAAACLNTVSKWASIKPEARATVTRIRDELKSLIA
jgi:DNA-binding transcriptional MerR regulator